MSCHAVLVVEGDALIRDTLLDLLLDQGYAVYGAENIERACVLLARMPHPCLVLADLLGGTDDQADCLRRRCHHLLPRLPLAILSSADLDPDPTAAPPAGDTLIRLPFDIDRFLDIVRRYCQVG